VCFNRALQPEQDSDTGSYAGQYMLDPKKKGK